MPWQIRCRIVIVAIIVAFGTSGHAVTNWVSAEALGDVAVSFDGAVHVFNNADGLVVDTIDTTSVSQLTGTNRGLAFDAALNLLVANTTGNQLVKLSPAHPHTPPQTGGTISTPSPAALAFAADGSVYVASAGAPATIRRFSKTGTLLRTFTVTTDSADCIGIDLSPDQKKLFVVSGGRNIRSVSDVSLTGPPPPPTPTVSPFVTLQGPGTACGLRLLAPIDIRSLDPAPPPGTTLPAVGGLIVADGREIKRLDRFGAVAETFNAGDTQPPKNKWVDVALDPNTTDFWGIDANADGPTQLAKFRIGGANQLVLSPLSGVPRGVAVNGELRAAQSIRILNLTHDVEGTATFLEPPFQHSWKGTAPVDISLAVQTYEVTYDAGGATPQVCPPSLDVRCRLQNFDDPVAGNPVPKAYSRGRSVVYREIWLSAPSNTDPWGISFVFPSNNTDTFAGVPCGPNVHPEEGSAVLRDIFPHGPGQNLFTIDPTVAFYGGDDVIRIRGGGNDSIAVDRADALNNMQIIKPVFGTIGNLGSSLPIAVEVTTPPGCTGVSGLESRLVLSVVDITAGVDAVVGDSKGFLGTLNGNGGIFAKVANQYRTNLDLTKGKFVKNHTYRLCIMASAAETIDGQFLPPPAGEVCRDILTK